MIRKIQKNRTFCPAGNSNLCIAHVQLDLGQDFGHDSLLLFFCMSRRTSISCTLLSRTQSFFVDMYVFFFSHLSLVHTCAISITQAT